MTGVWAVVFMAAGMPCFMFSAGQARRGNAAGAVAGFTAGALLYAAEGVATGEPWLTVFELVLAVFYAWWWWRRRRKRRRALRAAGAKARARVAAMRRRMRRAARPRPVRVPVPC